MKKIITCLSAFFLTVAVCHAITLDKAVKYALENSESIRITIESSKELRATGKQASAFVKPQVSFAAAYMEMGDNKPDSAIPGVDRDVSAEASLSQVLFAGKRIWRSLDLTNNYNNLAGLNEISGKRDIEKQVKIAFDTCLYRKSALDISINRLSQRYDELEDAKDLKEVGVVTQLDVRQTRLNVNFAKDLLKAGEASLKESLINFNLSIGRSGDEELLVPEGRLDINPDITPVFKKLYEKISKQDFLDIETLETQANGARLSYEIAKGERFPEILLVSSVKSNGDDMGDMDESWNIGLQLRWNMLDGGLVSAKKAAARSVMQQAGENRNKTAKALAGTVETLSVNAGTLAERIKLQQEAVILSKQNYEDARGQYRAGTITLTQMGEFHLSYAEARFNLISLFYMQRELLHNANALLE